MRLLLTVPPSALMSKATLERFVPSPYSAFMTSDPKGSRLGSGGGTAFVLEACHNAEAPGCDFQQWLAREPRIIVHSGGHSRRLPAYGPCGKVFTPIPVMRWARGQTCDQTLLSAQMPLYEDVMRCAPPHLRTLVSCGDVLVLLDHPLPPLPEEADVICFGIPNDVEKLMRHGVFFMPRSEPEELDTMLQKPSLEDIHKFSQGRACVMDIGLWLLSERAVEVLRCRSKAAEESHREYDLYSDFGLSMGRQPTLSDPLVADLRVCVVTLPEARFFHYGTTSELVSSTLTLQNFAQDKAGFLQPTASRHPSIFVQNAYVHNGFNAQHRCLWVENSEISSGWTLDQLSVVTGVPRNEWRLNVPPRVCIDVVPVRATGKDKTWGWVARPYGFDDAFRGAIKDMHTNYLGVPFVQWLAERDISLDTVAPSEPMTDIQHAHIFPCCHDVDTLGLVVRWMIGGELSDDERTLARNVFLAASRYSANALNDVAQVEQLLEQREAFQRRILPCMAAHHDRSPFYQLDLNQTAVKYAAGQLPLPAVLAEDEAPVMRRIHHHMFRARVLQYILAMYRHQNNAGRSQRGENDVEAGENGMTLPLLLQKCSAAVSTEVLQSVYGVNGPTELAEFAAAEEAYSFKLLQTGILHQLITSSQRPSPRLSIYDDQIVWGRSPARIDLSGGWTDTPPYSILCGGNVVNVAINLNGQPPLQVYLKASDTLGITIRSIDLGSIEFLSTFEELRKYDTVGSPFSIPKAALALAGFLPEFGAKSFATLKDQLCASFRDKGIEMTLLVAIPAGSGLGTSSLVAATVLSALSDFCGLGWDACEVGRRTLCLEQLLTTGGGWQDQYGGLFRGLKLLQSEPGFAQNPCPRWLPEHLFEDPRYAQCHLLYYTGITRTAKVILAEIVRGMFLNSASHLSVLREMRQQALNLHDAITRGEFKRYGCLIASAWDQNKRLDSGTCSAAIAEIVARVEKDVWGLKLPGAGGGGYLYMVAKDIDAAQRIREELTSRPPNSTARFVDMSISHNGIQVSRS